MNMFDSPLFDGPGITIEACASTCHVETITPSEESFERTGPSVVRKSKPDGKLAAKFDSMADGLEKHIEDRCRPMTQNATPKRMKEYRSRCHDGENLKRLQRALRVLADLHEEGQVPHGLQKLRTKDEIQGLVRKAVNSGAGGYYDVITCQEYYDKSPAGVLLQSLIDKTVSSAVRQEQERVQRIAKLEADVQFRKLPGFFPTPKVLIERMLMFAEIKAGNDVLEPSAGKGDIAEAIRTECPKAKLAVCEYNSVLEEILKLKGFTHAGNDFLAHRKQYDRIVMNPPFENGQDVEHVRHAYDLLREGGTLVAIMSPSAFFRKDKKYEEFRQWFKGKGQVEEIESGAFARPGAFRQTGVSSRLVVIEKCDE